MAWFRAASFALVALLLSCTTKREQKPETCDGDSECPMHACICLDDDRNRMIAYGQKCGGDQQCVAEPSGICPELCTEPPLAEWTNEVVPTADAGTALACTEASECSSYACVCLVNTGVDEMTMPGQQCNDGGCGDPAAVCTDTCQGNGLREWTGRVSLVSDGGVDAETPESGNPYTDCVPPQPMIECRPCRPVASGSSCVSYQSESLTICTTSCALAVHCPGGFACTGGFCLKRCDTLDGCDEGYLKCDTASEDEVTVCL